MVRHARCLAATLALAFGTLGAGSALAQNEVVSEARLANAKRHMELVCQPLENRRQFAKAARCFSNVTAYLTDATVALAEPAQPRPVRVAVEAPTRVALIAPRRTGGLLTSNFVLSGVGF